MDSLIKRFDSSVDGDLAFCPHRGVAYQHDMRPGVTYDAAYFEKCLHYDPDICHVVNAGRVALVNRYHQGRVLDIGIGAGHFILEHGNAHGYDINQRAVEWLKDRCLYSDDLNAYQAFTFWDVLEHVADPTNYLKQLPQGSLLFASLPTFGDLSAIRTSKHYRPGEHFYYWTPDGFVTWMALYGFRLLEISSHEIDAGRDGILSFAFKRDLPGYHEFLAQYKEMHAKRYYGASARLYLDEVASVVREASPTSILDYGCGRSDLAAYFWLDGARRIERYDPAIPEFKRMPDGEFDLVLCCDVMEHIPMASVDRILGEVRTKSARAVFVISTKPSRAVLPSGQNAHITLLTKNEWSRWIKDVFGKVSIIDTQWPHVFMAKTF